MEASGRLPDDRAAAAAKGPPYDRHEPGGRDAPIKFPGGHDHGKPHETQEEQQRQQGDNGTAGQPYQ